MVTDMPGQVNLAAYDIDRDGIPEFAVESGFAMQQAKSAGSGLAGVASGRSARAVEGDQVDSYPTAHHIAWADLFGDGHKVLINAPLVGPTNQPGRNLKARRRCSSIAFRRIGRVRGSARPSPMI